MKHLIMRIVYFISFILRLDAIVYFFSRKKVTIISYHDVNPELFDLHMSFLCKKYNFITLDQYLEYHNHKIDIPNHSMVITFDDGHAGNYKLLPLFKKYNIKPTIYCCSNIVGSLHTFWWKQLKGINPMKYKKMPNSERLRLLEQNQVYYPSMEKEKREALSKEEITEMMPYIDIGSHTVTHPILPQCNQEEESSEIIESKKQLEKMFNTTVKHFAYPNGDYTSDTIKLIQQAGYKTARTTKPGWNSKDTDLFQLKLTEISDNADLYKMRFQLTGIQLFILHKIRRK